MTAVVRRQKEIPLAFEPHAIKVAEAARTRSGTKDEDKDAIAAARFAEIQQWKHHVGDLHRVLSVAQGMFYLLEHNNEPLLRVAIEIVCDQTATKVLWWTEEWYSDEERREYFRKLVNGKLANVMAAMQVEAPEEEADEAAKEMEEKLRLALERASQAESSREAMERAKKSIEDQVKDLESKVADFKSKEQDMQKAQERMQNELIELRNTANKPTGAPDPELLSKLAEMEAKMKAAEELKAMMQAKLEKAEAKANEPKGPAGHSDEELADLKKKLMSDMEQKLKDEQARTAAAEKKASEAANDAEKLKKDLEKASKVKPVAVQRQKTEDHSAEDALSEEVHELQDSLDKETRRADQLLTENDGLKSEMERLRAEAEKLRNAPPKTVVVEREVIVEVSTPTGGDDTPSSRKKAPKIEEHVEERPKKQVQAEPVETVAKVVQSGVPQEVHDATCRELEKAMAKLSNQKALIGELRDEKEALETRNERMLKMLHDLKEQIRKITEIAEKKGCGDLVKGILEESGVTKTLDSPEFTCFDRLYEDAKRRQEKMRLWNEERFGQRPGSPQVRGKAFFSNRNWAPGGGQSWNLDNTPVSNSRWGDMGEQSNNLNMGSMGMPGVGGTGSMGMGSMGGTEFSNTGNIPSGSPTLCYYSEHAQTWSPATWTSGGAEPIAAKLQPIAPARAWTQGGELTNDAGEYDFDLAAYRACTRLDTGMRVVGHSMEGYSDAVLGHHTSVPLSRAQTPVGLRNSPASQAETIKDPRLLQGMGLSHSQSLGGLTAMSQDIAQSSPLPLKDRTLKTTPLQKKLAASRSGMRYDDTLPFSPVELGEGNIILANNVWGFPPNHGGLTKGVFSDRPMGPGSFRGFKLTSVRSQSKLSPLRTHSQMLPVNADDFLQTAPF